MASKYWIKLYHEILDDPKMGRLSDRLWRRVIELFLIAGDYDRDGELPAIDDIAWRLRTDNETLHKELTELERIGIVSVNGSIHLVTNFAERQQAMSVSERVSRFRDSKHKEEYYGNDDVTETVTNRYTDIDIDIDTEEDIDTDKKEIISPFMEMRECWIKLFPDKPHPRHNNKTLAGKVSTRMKSQHFKDNWYKALVKASKSNGLRTSTWFDFAFIVQNGDNYEKVLNGKYDFLDKPGGYGPPPRVVTPKTAEDWA